MSDYICGYSSVYTPYEYERKVLDPVKSLLNTTIQYFKDYLKELGITQHLEYSYDWDSLVYEFKDLEYNELWNSMP